MKEEISEREIRGALPEQFKQSDYESDEGSVGVQKTQNKVSAVKRKCQSKYMYAEVEKTACKKKRQTKSKDEQKHPEKKKKHIHVTPLNTEYSEVIKRPKRPPPKVVIFEEPGKLNGQKRQKTNIGRGISTKGKSSQILSSDEEDADFMSVARDVREFGMTGFSKKERRKYEQQKAQALGAKAPKGLKMPYPILMSVIRVNKKREKKKQELDRAMGMATKKKANRKDKKEHPAKTGGWWTDNSSKGFDVSVGKFKGGVQRLSKDDIKKIKSRKKR